MPWSMPAIVFVIVSAASASAGSLAQVAFNESIRRLFTPPATWKVSSIDIPPAPPAPPAPPEPPPATAGEAEKTAADKDKDKAKDEGVGDEKAWHEKMTNARDALERDQVLREAMQSRINGLTADFAARDDPAQRAEIERQRQRALDELDRLDKQIKKDKDDIAAIEEDARKKGIPPGWIRLRP